MSFLVCPLCGKSSSLKHFDPSGFDLDIYGQDVAGLGRGRGFVVTGRYSMLESEEAVMIKNRMLDLLVLLYKNGMLEDSEISRRFKITKGDDEVYASNALLEEQRNRINRLTEELGATQALLEDRDSVIRDLRRRLGAAKARNRSKEKIKDIEADMEGTVEESEAFNDESLANIAMEEEGSYE